MDTLDILARFLDNEGSLVLLGRAESGAVVPFGLSLSYLLWTLVKRARFGLVLKEDVDD